MRRAKTILPMSTFTTDSGTPTVFIPIHRADRGHRHRLVSQHASERLALPPSARNKSVRTFQPNILQANSKTGISESARLQQLPLRGHQRASRCQLPAHCFGSSGCGGRSPFVRVSRNRQRLSGCANCSRPECRALGPNCPTASRATWVRR